MESVKGNSENKVLIKESEQSSIRKWVQGILEDLHFDSSASISSIVKPGDTSRLLELCQNIYSPDIQDCAAACLAILSNDFHQQSLPFVFGGEVRKITTLLSSVCKSQSFLMNFLEVIKNICKKSQDLASKFVKENIVGFIMNLKGIKFSKEMLSPIFNGRVKVLVALCVQFENKFISEVLELASQIVEQFLKEEEYWEQLQANGQCFTLLVENYDILNKQIVLRMLKKYILETKKVRQYNQICKLRIVEEAMTTLSGKVLNDKEMKIIQKEKAALVKMLSQNVNSGFGEVRNASLVAIISIEDKREFNQQLFIYLTISVRIRGSQGQLNEDKFCRIVHVINCFSDIYFKIDIELHNWLKQNQKLAQRLTRCLKTILQFSHVCGIIIEKALEIFIQHQRIIERAESQLPNELQPQSIIETLIVLTKFRSCQEQKLVMSRLKILRNHEIGRIANMADQYIRFIQKRTIEYYQSLLKMICLSI